MNIKDLQKLDFLLKMINSIDQSSKYKIAFGFKGVAYVGDFISSTDYIKPKTWNFKIKELDLETLKTNNLNVLQEIPYCTIEGKNEEWKDIWQNGESDLFRSDICKLYEASQQLKASDYLKLLTMMLNNHEVIFNDTLLPYIYNVRCLTNKLLINFIKAEDNVEFDYISLILEDQL